MTEMHQHIPKNEHGRDFVVGDIHGCYKLLMKCLDQEGFNQKADRLFSVGDLIDRGPDSLKCLKLLQEQWFYAVRGNHEEMMANACFGDESYSWRTQYGRWAKRLDENEMVAWARRIQAMPLAMTIAGKGYSIGMCHAEPDGKTWADMVTNPKSADVFLWGRRVLRNRPDYDVNGIDLTIHGHTPLDRPTWVGNRYFMDTGACYSGELTLRKIDDIWAEYSAQKNLFGS